MAVHYMPGAKTLLDRGEAQILSRHSGSHAEVQWDARIAQRQFNMYLHGNTLAKMKKKTLNICISSISLCVAKI